jgi:two-component system cell cycle sensor histidine kinase PleC
MIQNRNELTYKLLEKANTAQKARREFLATVSHELRTPLNAILGFSEILKGEMFGEFLNERYSSCARDIHSSGTHLLTILNEILDVARNDTAEMQLQEDEMNLSEAIHGCIGIFRNEAEAKGIEIILRGAERPIAIRADQKRIRQILLNLLSNAVKFTPEGGRVTVTARTGYMDGVFISVSDTGIGIAPADIERATKPFEQIANAASQSQRGTGLGLSITEKIAQLHGGSMHIESAPGIGTTVSILLPRSRLALTTLTEPLRAAS